MEKKQRALLVCKYSVYSVAILMLLSFVIQYLGAPFSLFFNLLLVILSAEMLFCCNEYKRRSGLGLSFKDSFAMCWQVSFIAGLINASGIFVLVKLAGQDKLRGLLDKYKDSLVANTAESEEMIAQILDVIANPWFLFFYFNIVYIVLGLFISILIAFWAKGNNYPRGNE